MEFQLPKNFSVFIFGSHRFKDRTVDTVEGKEIITSMYQSNLHHTEDLLKKRHRLQEWSTGTYFSYKYKQFKVGISSFYLHFDTPILASQSLYKKYSFSGRNHWNGGFDFRWTIRNFYFFGEFGISPSGGSGTIFGILAVLHPKITTNLVLRNYEKNYPLGFFPTK
jgi:hypothetical protein